MRARPRPDPVPTKSFTFRVTAAQRAAYKRASAATGAQTLDEALTRALDEWAHKIELDLDWACTSHPRHHTCPQCVSVPRPRKKSK